MQDFVKKQIINIYSSDFYIAILILNLRRVIMSWTGKLLGGGVGFALAGPIGAIIGGIIGNQFDNSSRMNNMQSQMNREEKSQMIFFTTTFSMFAKFAQADGKVTKSEIKVINNFVRNELHLDEQTRKLAIEIFDKAKRNNNSFEEFAQQFYDYFRGQRQLVISIIDLLMKLAIADDDFNDVERKYLLRAKEIFNISDSQYESIKSRYMKEDNLKKYYQILGVSENASMNDIKKKYRKKVKQYHPDNIIGKGLPEEFADFAEEKFKEIQKAYEVVREEKRAS